MSIAYPAYPYVSLYNLCYCMCNVSYKLYLLAITKGKNV